MLIPFSSSGRGPAILINCFLGAWIFMLAFKQNSIFLARNSSEITEIVTGILIILFSLYDSYKKKEKNTVWEIPTWLIGSLILIIGIAFYLYNNSLL
ncbi:MAG TPA: hypothetical protein VEG39_02250 [Clostridia bacterium]|nr:hypothetical protein [Clostridia bacterium]